MIYEKRRNDYKFYFAEFGARVCDIIGKKEAPKQFVMETIALSKIAKPLFARHKTDSSGNLLELQFRALYAISNV
jgi:hypothetical protein